MLLKRRRQRRLKHRRSLPPLLGRVAQVGGLILGLVAVLAVLAAGLGYASLTAGLPSLQSIPTLLDPQTGLAWQPTRLYDHTGEHLLTALEVPGLPRRALPLDPSMPESLSPFLVQAAVGLLEPGFWQAGGFSWQHLTDPEPVTIAERLVNDLLLEQEAPGLRRALRMRLLAAQLTAHFGRAQVLEWYLNSAWFGRLAYGAESAAWLYLGKSASQLTLGEAALLMAVSQAPALNPLDSPAGARDRQLLVLASLLDSGAIGTDAYTMALQQPLEFAPAPPLPAGIAPAFTRLALEQLKSQVGAQRVERGGLVVLTSLDYDLQINAACAAQTQLVRLEGKPEALAPVTGADCPAARLLPTLPPGAAVYPSSLVASVAVLDLESGHVLALVGDATVAADSAALSGHAPASLLTPLAAAAAFASGMSPASLVWDIPLPGDAYANPDGTWHGPQRLRMAVANDYLAPLARLQDELGSTGLPRMAFLLGLADIAGQANPAQLLYGGGEATVLQVAQAYSAFATLGTQTGQAAQTGDLQPVMVLSVSETNGRALTLQLEPQTRTVFSPPLAYLVHAILGDEAARWASLGHPNPLEIGRPVGAKIGRLADGSAAWTAGYTPQRMVVTWLGAPAAAELSTELRPEMAAGLWYAVIQYASRDMPAVDWTVPAGVTTLTVCDPSGLLPTIYCPTTLAEVFLVGNEPTGYDTLYRTVQVNRETGLLATVFTPLELVEERTYLVVPPEAQDWARSAGLDQPPVTYDAIAPRAPIPHVEITSPPLFAYVGGTVTVRGSAGGDGFQSFTLQVGQGLNPSAWQQIAAGSTAVDDAVLGTWVTEGDGLYAMRLLVVRSDQSVQTAVTQVTVDNTPPVVRLLYPAAGQQFSRAAPVAFQADVDEALGVARLVWLVDGSPVGETSSPPYRFTWTSTPGSHNVQVQAYDLAGNLGVGALVEFVVEN